MAEKRREVWKPQPGSQEMVLSCPAFELLYHGTRGPGKSDTLLMDFAQHVGQGWGPSWRGIIFRQTYKQLGDLITKSKKWFPQIFPNAKFNGSDHKWVFPDGEELLLRQFQREDDYWNYHGHEYTFVGWDELTNWPDNGGYKRMMSCCRSAVQGIPMKYRATTNPYGPGHNWVKHHFRLPERDGIPIATEYEFADIDTGEIRKTVLHRIAIHGNVYENKILLRAQPNYIGQLKESARNPAELAAWLEGSWDIVAGGMFDDVWDRDIHILDPFPIPRRWRLWRAFDWGSSKPFSVGWYAESDGSDYRDHQGQWRSTVRGDLFRFAEWYGWNGQPNEGLRPLASVVAQGIVEREFRMGIRTHDLNMVSPGPADSQIYAAENGVSIAVDMAMPFRRENGTMASGVTWARADKRPGSRKTGWELFRKWLKKAKRERNLPREEPGLFVWRNCEHFVRTVPSLPRDPKDLDDVNTEAEDHVADEVRYMVRFMGNRASTGRVTGHH